MQPKMRTLISILLLCTLISSVTVAQPAEASEIKLYINGVLIQPDVPPFLHNNRTLVPVRVIAERLGADVQWNQSLQRVTIIREQATLVFFIGSSEAWVNDRKVILDTEPLIKDGRTMVPVRFISERLGADVSWDDASRTVYVDSSPIKLTDVSYQDGDGVGRLVLTTSQEAEFVSSIGSQSTRILVTLPGTAAGVPVRTTAVNQGGVRQTVVRVLSDGSAQVQIDLEPGQVWQEEVQDCSYSLLLPRMVKGIAFEQGDGLDRVAVQTTGRVRAHVFSLEDPLRTVLDMEYAVLPEGEGLAELEHDYLDRIRFAQYSPEQVRVVADMKESVPYRLTDTAVGVDLLFAAMVKEIIVHDSAQGIQVQVRAENGMVTNEPSGSNRILWAIPDAVWSDGALIRYWVDGQEAKVWTPAEAAQLQNGSGYNMKTLRIRSFATAQEGLLLEIDLDRSCQEMNVVKNNRTETTLDITNPPPLPLEGRIVVLDPGHGGSAPGAVGPSGTTEKEVNLAIGLKLRDELKMQGATVVMTRDRDIQVSLTDRAHIANQANADIFISIHANGYYLESANGTETFYHTDNHPNSIRLGQYVHTNMVLAVGLRDRGLKTADFTVLQETTMPAVLVEVAFLTNPTEEALLKSSSFQQKAAAGISQGVLTYFAQCR